MQYIVYQLKGWKLVELMVLMIFHLLFAITYSLHTTVLSNESLRDSQHFGYTIHALKQLIILQYVNTGKYRFILQILVFFMEVFK